MKGRDPAKAPKPRPADDFGAEEAGADFGTDSDEVGFVVVVDDEELEDGSDGLESSPPRALGLIAPVLPLMPPERAVPLAEDEDPASQLGPDTPALALELAKGEEDEEKDEKVGCFRAGVGVAAAWETVSDVVLGGVDIEGCGICCCCLSVLRADSSLLRFASVTALLLSLSS